MAYIGNAFQLTTSLQQLYACPAATNGAMHALVFANTTGAPVNVTVSHYVNSTGLTTAFTFPVPANSVYPWPKAIDVQSGDTISASAASNSAVAAEVSVYTAVPPSPLVFNPRGAWSSGASYATLDVVSANGGSYVALQASTNQTPPAGTNAYWMQLTAQGATGAAGGVTTIGGLSGVVTLAALLASGATFGGKAHFTAMDDAWTALGNVSGTVNIDCSAAQAYTFTVTGATTLAFVNPPAANQSQVILFRVINGGAFTFNFPAGSKYPGGAIGQLTTSGADRLAAVYEPSISAWEFYVLGKAVA